MPRKEAMKVTAMQPEFLAQLRKDFQPRPLAPSTPMSPPPPPLPQRPHLWAGSLFWQPGGMAPCPWTVAAYCNDPNGFGTGSNAVTLRRAGAQFLLIASVSVRLYDASITAVDFTHVPSSSGGLQQTGFYVRTGTGRIVASAYSALDSLTQSNPPEKVLSATAFFEAWSDNEELKLYVNAGYSHPQARPTKLWARLLQFQIVRL